MNMLRSFPAALVVALLGIGAVQAQDTMGREDRQEKSAQPVDDGWITTKVKTEMIASKGVPARDITVETVNGVVSLRGTVTNQAEVDQAVAVARRVKGVTNVDSSALKVAGKTQTPAH